jgi:hypothetical protein
MTQFHEGQEVEVSTPLEASLYGQRVWRKAKIVKRDHMTDTDQADERLTPVRFRDGTRGVFNVDHIRAANLRVSSNDPTGTREMDENEKRRWCI